MANILIVFGSTTGNTESVAKQIAKHLIVNGHAATVKNVVDISLEEFGAGQDLTVFGVSTWGDDEIEMQEDFAEFFPHLDQVDFKSRKVALFGCGDSSYTFFCGAVDLLEDKIDELGGILVHEPLKIDGDPQGAMEEIERWSHQLDLACR